MQPSLLACMSRPADVQQTPVWAAKVRERLLFLESSIRRLEREKQVLLTELAGLPEEVIQTVLAGSRTSLGDSGRSQKQRPERRASDTATLWESTKGHPTSFLRSGCDGAAIHPALIDQAEDQQVKEKSCADPSACSRERRASVVATPSPVRARSLTGQPENAPLRCSPLSTKCEDPLVEDVPSKDAVQADAEAPVSAVAASRPQEEESPDARSTASTVLVSSDEEAPLSPLKQRRLQSPEMLPSPPGELGMSLSQALAAQLDAEMDPPLLATHRGLLERVRHRRSSEALQASGLENLAEELATDALPAEDGSNTGAVGSRDSCEILPPSAAPGLHASHEGSGTAQASGTARSSRRGAAPRRLVPEQLSTDDLKTWFLFFGMKPVQSRDFMINRLREIDWQLHGEAPEPPAPVPATRGRPRKQVERTPSALSSPKAPASEVMPPTAQSPRTSKRAATAAAKAAELELMAVETIRRDTELYERLLLYEPVPISELRERMVALQPELRALGEQRLRKLLDREGLLYSSTWNQGRDGTRRRL